MRPRGQFGTGGGNPLGMVFTRWVKVLMIATGVASLIGAVLDGWVKSKLPSYLLLEPQAVWGGSPALPGIPAVWQVITYPFLEFNWLSLLFALLMYGWFAGSLEVLWGSRRFLINWLVLAVGSALLTIGVAAIWEPVQAIQVAGTITVIEGLIIAWGLSYPNQEFRLFFVLPMKGIYIVWLTMGLLALRILFAQAEGFPYFVPEIFGVLLGFVIVYDKISLRKIRLRLKKLQLEQQLKREQAARDKRGRRAEELGLRVVDDDDDDDEDPDKPKYLH